MKANDSEISSLDSTDLKPEMSIFISFGYFGPSVELWLFKGKLSQRKTVSDVHFDLLLILEVQNVLSTFSPFH